MIDKRDLRIGNMFEQGVVCKINGRTGAKVHLYGKIKYDGKDRRVKAINSVGVEDLQPIILTPKVLVEWCGFRDMGDGVYCGDDYALIWNDGCFMHGAVDVRYLHKLQNLHYVITEKELEIKG